MESCKYRGRGCGQYDCPETIPEECPNYKLLEKAERFWSGWPLEKDVDEVLK